MSPNTFTSETTDLRANVEEQIIETTKGFEAFSIIALKRAQLYKIGILQNIYVVLLAVCSSNVTENTIEEVDITARDKFQVHKKCIEKLFPAMGYKLVSLATYGALPTCFLTVVEMR